MGGGSSWTWRGAGLGCLLLVVTVLTKASLRSKDTLFGGNGGGGSDEYSVIARASHLSHRRRGLHTPPTEYSAMRRWLQAATGGNDNADAEQGGDEAVVLDPSATIDGYDLDTTNRTCNFTVNYNTTRSLRELVPAGSAEEGAPPDEWVDAAELYLETLDLELVNFTNGESPCCGCCPPFCFAVNATRRRQVRRWSWQAGGTRACVTHSPWCDCVLCPRHLHLRQSV